MSDTVIHSSGDDSPVTDIAKDVGHVEGVVESHADKIEAHAENLTDLSKDAEWTKERLSNLESMVTSAPQEATAAVREEINSLRSSLESLAQMVESKLSESVPANTESTSAPEPVENKAEEKPSMFGALGRAFHKLL